MSIVNLICLWLGRSVLLVVIAIIALIVGKLLWVLYGQPAIEFITAKVKR